MELVSTVVKADMKRVSEIAKKFNGYISIKGDSISINIPDCVRVKESDIIKALESN